MKQVEADTYWKIKDYEKLLELRPTLTFVKSAMVDECHQVFARSRTYTDENVVKLKA